MSLGIEEKNIEICSNFSKGQIIAKFDELRTEASAFESKGKNRQAKVIAIVWVGFKLDDRREHHKKMLEQLNVQSFKADDGSSYPVKSFHLTMTGEAINLIEQSTYLL